MAPLCQYRYYDEMMREEREETNGRPFDDRPPLSYCPASWREEVILSDDEYDDGHHEHPLYL